MTVSRIVSGGQTGADIGGLEAALYCDLPHGGWCPKGRRQEKGRTIPPQYRLTETDSPEWEPRTEANVVDSDATLVLTCGEPTGGSKLTVELAKKHRKPCLHVDLDKPRKEVVEAIVEWLKTCPKSTVLNVAGSRESKSPGIQLAVMVRMVDVISAVNGKLFYPIQEEG